MAKSAFDEFMEQTTPESKGRKSLPINRETFQHPIVMEAEDDEKRVFRNNPSVTKAIPSGMHLTWLRVGTILDWHEDGDEEQLDDDPVYPRLTKTLPRLGIIGALPKTGIGLSAFCMVNGTMTIVSLDGSVDKLNTDGTIVPISLNLVNDKDLLPTCVGFGRHPGVHTKEVFRQKVLKQRLIRQAKIKSLKRKSLP